MKNYAKRIVDKYKHVFYFNSKGQYHRLNGPAAEYTDGSNDWYVNGKRHRLDGPAILLANGTKYWYLNSRRCSKSGHAKLVLFFILEPQRIDLNSTED